MKKIILLSFILFTVTLTLTARVIKVDINGSGQFSSISAALNAAVAGDTIKVLPGSYFEQVTINKNVVVMGSGYETTIINGNFNPTIVMSIGKILWFQISSTNGNGINLSGGIVSNCVISGCAGNGIYLDKGNASIINCVLIKNGLSGARMSSNGNLTITNTIARNNGNSGYVSEANCYLGPILTISFCDGSVNCANGNQGCFDQDPLFVSNTDLHISQGSPCWDKGNPSLFDPDGSSSDIGYFGGPDCPIYPVVKSITLIPQPDGSVKIQATGVANY